MRCVVRCFGNDRIAFRAFRQHFIPSSVLMLGTAYRITYIIQ